MLIVPNCRFIHPFAEEINITVLPNDGITVNSDVIYPLIPDRSTQYYTAEVSNLTTIVLPWTPINEAWIEIYIDGIRIINISNDFGLSYNQYVVIGNSISLSTPITGTLEVFCDAALDPVLSSDNIITVDNLQGSEAIPDGPGQTYASTWCEPLVCAQPQNGYVKVSDDRTSLIYVPNQLFVGRDSFSYALISQRGQLSKPKCVYINVEAPPPPLIPPN